MKYLVKHTSDMTKRQLDEAKTQLLAASKGKYFVLDYKGNAYGQYEEYDDAVDHADSLNEMEEL